LRPARGRWMTREAFAHVNEGNAGRPRFEQHTHEAYALAVLACSSCGHENPDAQKFCGDCGAGLSAPGETRRRLVTALFCDLVGSTELGERLDAEVLRKVLDRYFDGMRAAIQRHGGTVEKFVGDAVLGTFGVPEAHEDDTLRAVRAALEMRETAAEIDAEIHDPDVQIRVRIAINCGESFADEAAAMQGRIGGDVFNTAARLESVAEPGDVLVSAAAERMLRGRVELMLLGAIELKGKTESVHAYRVLGVRSSPIRVETPLVGRDRHLTVLRQALEDTIEDRACALITVLAPPGVGKSRLATTFANAVRERAMVLVGQTPSYGAGVTFAPLVELLSQAAGRPGGDAESVVAALRERLATQPDGPAASDRIAQLFGVGEALASDASWAVRRLLEVIASERPLVVVLEDVHWAETPMLDLVDAVIERVHGPVLFLCLARPELLEQRPTWAAGKPRAITTTLPPLSPEDARRVAESLLGAQAPPAVVDRVCQTAEGNPLYLEQLTAMLADQGLLVDGRWAGLDHAAAEIPVTLQALLAARLDRLEPTPRVVLERAAVEGRRFRTAALRALAPDLGAENVEVAIASLERRGFVQPEDEARGRWRFAHALVLEAAYRGLSKELRADLHVRLADWMIEEDAEQADVDESVARHLERALHLREELGARDEHSAALSERAGEMFATAGSRAFAALDLITSRDMLGRAAALLPERSPRRLDLLPNLGAALADSGRTEEAEALLSEAVEQARAAGSERDALRASVQLLSNLVYRSPTEAEIESAALGARSAADAFEMLDDHVGLSEASLTISYLEAMRGHIADSQEWASRALRHALAAGRPREATQAAGDLCVEATGGPIPFDRFAATARELLSTNEPISDSVGHALMAVAALAAGDDPGFHEHERRWREVLDRHGLAWLAAAHGVSIAVVEISVGKAEAAERRLREAREFLAAIGNTWWVDLVDGYLCEAVGAQDRPREFLRLADAFGATVQMTDRYTLIRGQLVLARAHLLRGSAPEAEVAARRALKLVEPTDFVPDHANALLVLAEVLNARDLSDAAAAARKEAIGKLLAKGNLAAVAHLGA
jgi:class 3 adenylate cyclase/tetratricopeptide (TPR) repeat protein